MEKTEQKHVDGAADVYISIVSNIILMSYLRKASVVNTRRLEF